MKKWVLRIIGIVLVIGALAGTLMSVSGIYFAWRIRPIAQKKMSSALDVTQRTVDATIELITVLDSSLQKTQKSLEDLEKITIDAATTIDATTPVVYTVADLFGEDFSSVVQQTQTSLDAAALSAKVVDDTLSLLTSIMSLNPFQTQPDYSPDVSLQNSISQVSEQLAELPGTLDEVQIGLKTTAGSLRSLQTDMEKTSNSIADIKSNIDEARILISGYSPILTEVKEAIEKARNYLTLIVDITTWGITIFLIWLVVAQLGLFTQGIDILSRERES